MVQLAWKKSGFPHERVIGMAGVLDSARFRTFIAAGAAGLGGERHRLRAGRPRRHHGAAAALLHGGGHPDHRPAAGRHGSRPSSRAPPTAAPRSSASSRPAAPTTRPAASAVEMVEAILKDKKKILPCAAYLDGQYGVKGLYVGVPVKLGARASSRSSRSSSQKDEQAAFDKSAAAVRELVDKLKL